LDTTLILGFYTQYRRYGIRAGDVAGWDAVLLHHRSLLCRAIYPVSHLALNAKI
jgi:hypothetical protein